VTELRSFLRAGDHDGGGSRFGPVGTRYLPPDTSGMGHAEALVTIPA
jgi:hypothetical protein